MVRHGRLPVAGIGRTCVLTRKWRINVSAKFRLVEDPGALASNVGGHHFGEGIGAGML